MNRSFFVRLSVSLLVVLLASQPGLAEEDQSIDPPEAIMNQPSPVLSPEASLKSFQIEEGFEIQLVAAEPLIEDPVCMAWDDRGRLWVCEMRGYMPDKDATGEQDPTGRIVILEDEDGDGTMDTSKVFLDKIILPRAIAFAKNGLLYADTKQLYFVRINAGDRPGAKIPVDRTYSGESNVEHQANGLLYGLDNWYYNAKSTRRYKQIGARFRTDKDSEFRGQWGITQDDDGRILTNRNSVLIEYELLPPSVTKRNPNFKMKPSLLKVSPKVWPAHATPGVNRGYKPSVLDHEGTWKLKSATAACGPVIYRGTQFPAEYYNNVFVPEPAGNLVKRITLDTNEDGKPTAKHAYDGREFLTSTDERNRFVNAYTGPDGALYLVDMYRGLIQHKTYITDYLRRQIAARDLEKPLGMGRIYRVVHKDSPIDTKPVNLSEMTSSELVALLGHENAWQRHNAQRLLVQRNDRNAVPALNAMASTSENPQARIHALWTLEGMRKLEPAILLAAGATDDLRVRAQVLRLAEAYEGESEAKQFVALMMRYSEDAPNWAIDMQLALSAGVLASIDTPQAYDVLLSVIDRRSGDKLFLSAIVTGLRGKEAVMLARVQGGPIKNMLGSALVKATEDGDLTIGSLLALVDSPDFVENRNDLLTTLATQAVQQDKVKVVDELIDKLSSDGYSEDNKRAILTGMAQGSQSRTSPMALNGKPDIFTAWQASAPPSLAEWVAQLDEMFLYERNELSEEVLERIEAGSLLYAAHCSTCHGEDGTGLEGAGPPVFASDWVERSPEMLAMLVLNGIEGPITVSGKRYEPPTIQTEMAGFKNAAIDDQQFADLLTFLRSSEMGNNADPIDPQVVTQMRTATATRNTPYTPEQLLKIDAQLTGEPVAYGSPGFKIVKASWLDSPWPGLIATLFLVTASMVVLLLGTLLASTLPKL